jgi:hypothetical protein
MDRVKLSPTISIAVSVGIGLLLVCATEIGLVLCVLIPTLCFSQKCRRHAFLTALGYYAAASSVIIPGALAFFGARSTVIFALGLWATASLLLATPYTMLWSANPYSARWRLPLAIVASVPPPLGIIGWANPLMSAGALFPGTGCFGLLAILTFAACSRRRPTASIIVLTGTAIVVNVANPSGPGRPTDWEVVNTTFGNTSVKPSDLVHQFRVARDIQHRALESRASVIVFPETVVPSWTEATDLFWRPTLTSLASKGKTILIGALINVKGSEKYQNVVLIRGAMRGQFVQRIPVPVAMWKPFSNDGVTLNLNAPNTIEIGKHRVASLICYEQILTWPLIRSMMGRPNIVVGVSNHHWAHGTGIPEVQRRVFFSWIRLFRIPYVLATNS